MIDSRQGGLNTVRRDRTGEVYAGLKVVGLGPRKKGSLGWACVCLTCGKDFVLESRRMAEYERRGNGCGCRAGVNFKTIKRRRFAHENVNR